MQIFPVDVVRSNQILWNWVSKFSPRGANNKINLQLNTDIFSPNFYPDPEKCYF